MKEDILEFLDIRYGRMNRRQFIVSIALCMALHFIFPEDLVFIFPSPLLEYAYILFLARRLRDVNVSAKCLYYFFAFSITTAFFVAWRQFLEELGQLSSGVIIVSMVLSTIYLILIVVCLPLLAILPSVIFGNEYGPEPEGWDFRTTYRRKKNKI